ncbi:MAG: HIT domain-containing protein [Thermoguttaceae bacterium]|nr:HIT domain-containing protein [Thermoguttaceae bacterium]MDW8036685.1 HIT domain-containing protein [Thermoguttaceae bacterium]
MANEQIWAPWRLAYIRGEDKQLRPPPKGVFLAGADPDCFLCQAVADPEEPLRYVVGQTELSICVLNRYPYTNGHLLVAPRRHCERLEQLSPTEQMDLLGLLIRMVQRLEKTLQPHGFNIGFNLGQAAGAGLPGHLHWHVVPRWQGDTNFMPVLASVNVIPQSLEALWQLLREDAP